MKMLFRHSIFISLYLVFSYNGYSQITQYMDFEPTVFEGTTVVEDIYSLALEGNLQGNPSTQPVKVYLPPGYSDFHDNRYPVVYILHGWVEDYNSFYYEYGLLNRLNRLISEKIMVPMIIVTPNAYTDYWGSWYTNSYVTGNWEDYIVNDVIQYIESKYRILDNQEYSGLAGYSMGAYGAVKIAMRYPSLFNSIGLMSAGLMDLETILMYDDDINKETMISATERPTFNLASRYEKLCLSVAVAVAPDSTAKPVMGRLPFDADGVLIDSIWQKWLEHDPYTMLPTYRDSLLKLKAIQLYIGDTDVGLQENDSFHLALQDYGIPHGYEIFQGGHNPSPVIDDVLIYFSEQLVGVVPTVKSSSDYYFENTDTLVAEMDMDGKIFVVPFSTNLDKDSIHKYQIANTDALANEEIELQLTGLEFGKYSVFAASIDSAISNIPVEFCVVPDTSLPVLNLAIDTVYPDDSIKVSCNRNGTICLVSCGWLGACIPLTTASEVLESTFYHSLIDSIAILADDRVSFSTDNLSPGSYMIYGFDQYGIVSEPEIVRIKDNTGIRSEEVQSFKLFPNPVTDLVTLQWRKSDKYNVEITSLNGQLLFSSQMEGTSHQIDLSSFQKGVYFITIRSEDFITTRKIIKL